MPYAVLAGVVNGAFGVLGPLLMLESLGIRRFGSQMGIVGLLSAIGYAAGVSVVSAVACLACRPLQSVMDERAVADSYRGRPRPPVRRPPK